MLGRKKSVLGKLYPMPLKSHGFWPFLKWDFLAYVIGFYEPCLEENVP